MSAARPLELGRDRIVDAPGADLPVTYAVGDVHGMYDLLIDLLQQIVADVEARGRPPATLVFLGDYVDRGARSNDVVGALLWLQRKRLMPGVFLRGNHEQMLLGYLKDPVAHRAWVGFGGDATLRSYGVEVAADVDVADLDHHRLRDALLDRMPVSHLQFLQGLTLHHQTDHHILVHAGIRPGVPLARQEEDDLLWIREGFLEERPLRGKRVVHGHTWVDAKPVLLPHRVGVDTGGYATGVLTAARLVGEDVSFITAQGARPYGDGASVPA